MLIDRLSRHLRPALLAAGLLSGTLALGGCVDGHDGLASTGNFGEAVRQTLAAQVIDPAPHYDAPDPVTSGQQAAVAQDRYNAGAVKQPERITTRAGGN